MRRRPLLRLTPGVLAAALGALAALVFAVQHVLSVDISSATYTSQLAITAPPAGTSALVAALPLSGQALSDGGFVAADTTDAVIVDGATDEVPSQPPSLRQSMDGAVADDGGVQTDETTASNNATIDDMTLLPTVPVAGDAYYFGADHRYRILALNLSRAGVGVWTITWEYWDGAAWVALANVDDRTSGFTATGLRTVSWDMPQEWERTTVAAVADKYWVRARVSAFTSVTTAPRGQQAYWETGVWWAFTGPVAAGDQVSYIMALRTQTETVDHHQFFPGPEGYVTPDNAALELGSSVFLIEIDAYVQTDVLTGAVMNKPGAIRLYNSAPGSLTLEMNGLTSTTVTNVDDGRYDISISDDGTTITLAVGESSATLAHTATVNTANAWTWGNAGAVTFFDEIRLAFPIQRIDDTTAEWDAGTLSNVDGVANNLQLTEQAAFPGGVGAIASWPVGSCTSCFIGQTTQIARTGSRSLKMHNRSATINEPSLAQREAATPGQIWSASAYCKRSGLDASITVRFLDAAFAQLATFSSGECPSVDPTDPPNVAWGLLTNQNRTAPASTAWVELRLEQDANSNVLCSQACAWWDDAMLNLGTVAATYPSASNVLENASFEQVYPASGNRIAPGLTVSSATNVFSSSIAWAAVNQTGTTFTVEVSLDNGLSYLTATVNGGPIPGIDEGDNLALTPAIISRVLMLSPSQDATPLMSLLRLSIIDSDDLDLYYAPQEFIGESLDDRSANDIDAAVSYPLEGPFVVTVGPFVPVEPATIVAVEVSASDIIPVITEPEDFASLGSGLADVPLFGVLIAHWASFVGVEPHVAWAGFIGMATLAMGGLTAWFTRSVTMAGGVMAVGMLFASNLALSSPIPLWGVLFAGIGIVGVLVWLDRR